MDYVGQQRSPLWDDVEALTDENERIQGEVPDLEKEVAELTQKIVQAARRTKMITIYKTADPENTVSVLCFFFL